jgi:hypothetical protein
MLAISSQVKKPEEGEASYPELPLILFFSQYTFDSDGKMLWLTGSAEIVPDTNQVSIPIERVNQGKFRSSEPAQRSTVGSVTLTVNNCNDIRFEYDYSSLGLGTGSRRMQRLFSLETAGYDCRDYAAQAAANQ